MRIQSTLHRSDHPEGAPHVWAVQTTNNRSCGFLTGATTTFGRLRANFACGNVSRRGVLWGLPRQRGALWHIYFSKGASPKRLHLVGISHAWL